MPPPFHSAMRRGHFSGIVAFTLWGALGYYLTPFLNMLFGRLFFAERHNRLQTAAIALAAAGVAFRFHAVEGVP